MVLQEFSGQIALADNNEDTVFDISNLNNHSAIIFLDAMQSLDIVVIRVYVKDVQGAALKKLYSFSLANAQDTSLLIPPIQTSEFKVTIQQTSGTLRTFNWARYTQ